MALAWESWGLVWKHCESRSCWVRGNKIFQQDVAPLRTVGVWFRKPSAELVTAVGPPGLEPCAGVSRCQSSLILQEATWFSFWPTWISKFVFCLEGASVKKFCIVLFSLLDEECVSLSPYFAMRTPKLVMEETSVSFLYTQNLISVFPWEIKVGRQLIAKVLWKAWSPGQLWQSRLGGRIHLLKLDLLRECTVAHGHCVIQSGWGCW